MSRADVPVWHAQSMDSIIHVFSTAHDALSNGEVLGSGTSVGKHRVTNAL
jgi:hypothetical protein